MRQYSLTSNERIRKSEDFQLLYKEGKKSITEHFIFFFRVKGIQKPMKKLGITVTKGVGNACERNRIKRQVRDFYRLHKGEIPGGWLVIMAKKSSLHADNRDLRADLKRGFEKISAGVING